MLYKRYLVLKAFKRARHGTACVFLEVSIQKLMMMMDDDYTV